MHLACPTSAQPVYLAPKCSLFLLAANCTPLQVLAYGSCVDGNTCFDYYSCQGSVGKVLQTADQAWASPLFSSVTWVAGPGTHTVLVRINRYSACGGSLAAPNCFVSGTVKAKLELGEWGARWAARSGQGLTCCVRGHACLLTSGWNSPN